MAVVNGIASCVSLDAAGGTSFTEVTTTRGWRVNYTNAQAQSVPSNAAAGKIVTAGSLDFSGSFDYDGLEPPLYPGQTGTFLGYNGSKSAQGAIIVESASLTCDVAGSGNVGGTCNFAGNGALSFVSTTDADATSPQVFNSVGGGRIDWKPNGQSNYATLPDVLQWSLNYARVLAPYVSSSTAGLMKRTAGSYAMSGSFTILQSALDYLSTTANAIVPGTAGRMLFYPNASQYIEVWFPVIQANEFGGAPDENGAVTINWEGSIAGTYISSVWTPGKVLKVGAASAWFGSV